MSESRSRAEKAAQTRARLVDRARELFLARGYAATTTREVAAAAGITERTLFNIVPSKSELLRQVLLADVFHAEYEPLLVRSDFAASLAAPTMDQFLDRFSGWVTDLHGRSAALAETVRAAAVVDVAAAEIWQWGQAQQVVDCRQLVDVLRSRSWMPDRPSASEQGDSLAVLSGHETYWRLVMERRWSPARYRQWLQQHCAPGLL